MYPEIRGSRFLRKFGTFCQNTRRHTQKNQHENLKPAPLQHVVIKELVCAALYNGIHWRVLPSRIVYMNSLGDLQPLFSAADT